MMLTHNPKRQSVSRFAVIASPQPLARHRRVQPTSHELQLLKSRKKQCVTEQKGFRNRTVTTSTPILVSI
jgi:hypothetical protein